MGDSILRVYEEDDTKVNWRLTLNLLLEIIWRVAKLQLKPQQKKLHRMLENSLFSR